jgi:FixJ family two-component response regulator
MIKPVPAIGVRVAGSEDARSARTTELRHSWVGIVDDDASLRAALARALRFNGIPVETFGSAEEFLHRRVAGEPGCIVLDIHLGGISGFDLQDMLESKGAAPPIIFITAHDDMLAERARSSGAFGYLRKPFETQALVALLRRLTVSE